MKKLLFSSFALASIAVFAYTQIDVDNANYLATRGIITQQSNASWFRLDDAITRAEIAGIALKLRGTTLPEGYICKNYFSDVKYNAMNNWICRAVELAADAGFVTRANTTFRPQDKVTRAEAFSMIYKASGNTLDIPEKMTVGNVAIDKDIAYWQQELFFKITSIDRINIPGIKFVREVQEDSPANGSHEYYFYPNRAATRAEIFSFAKNILEYKPLCSLDSPNFTCGNITMGAEPGPNYNPPEVCGCKPISCPAGQSVIISPDVGYWPDGSAKGIFTCSSEYPA